MKKAILVLLILVMALSAVALACSQPAPSPAPTTKPTTTAPATTPAPTATAKPTTTAPTTTAAPTATAKPTVEIKAITLKAAHDYPETHWYHTQMKKLADDVKQRTGGKVTIQIYPAGSLVKSAEMLKSVQSGIVDIGALSLGFSFSETPFSASAGFLPFGWTLDQAQKVAVALAPAMTKELGKYNQNVLWVTGVADDFFLTKPIEDVNNPDLKGAKVRSPGKQFEQPLKLMGATPISMVTGEVPTALSTGMLQGAYTSYDFYKSAGWSEWLKYVYRAESLVLIGASFTMNQKTLDGLQPEVRAIIMDEANNVIPAWHWPKLISDTAKIVSDIKAMKGVTVVDLTPAQRVIWRTKLLPTWTDFVKQFGQQGQDWVNQVEQITGQKVLSK